MVVSHQDRVLAIIQLQGIDEFEAPQDGPGGVAGQIDHEAPDRLDPRLITPSRRIPDLRDCHALLEGSEHLVGVRLDPEMDALTSGLPHLPSELSRHGMDPSLHGPSRPEAALGEAFTEPEDPLGAKREEVVEEEHFAGPELLQLPQLVDHILDRPLAMDLVRRIAERAGIGASARAHHGRHDVLDADGASIAAEIDQGAVRERESIDRDGGIIHGVDLDVRAFPIDQPGNRAKPPPPHQLLDQQGRRELAVARDREIDLGMTQGVVPEGRHMRPAQDGDDVRVMLAGRAQYLQHAPQHRRHRR